MLSKFYNDGRCVYCGEHWDTWDHFIPQSVVPDGEGNNWLLACCWECNMLARDKLFSCVEDKRVFVKRKITEKFFRELDNFWGAAGHTEAAFQRVGDRYNRRMSWNNEEVSENVSIAGLHLRVNGAGKSFVPPPVSEHTRWKSERELMRYYENATADMMIKLSEVMAYHKREMAALRNLFQKASEF